MAPFTNLRGKTVYAASMIPKSAGKGTAVARLREALGYSIQETVVTGDGGNDTQMLSGPEHGIVVGNAQPELRALADKGQLNNWQVDPTLSRKAAVLILQMDYRCICVYSQASAGHADGILEGLERLGFIPEEAEGTSTSSLKSKHRAVL